MRPVLMVVVHVLGHKPLEMPFIQNDDMVQQISSATSHQAVSDAILPRALKRGTYRPTSHFPRGRYHVAAKFRIAIEQQELVRDGVWPRFSTHENRKSSLSPSL